ncbi:DUF4240 domain-containing protein [Dysgonomonas reticulitermitis]
MNNKQFWQLIEECRNQSNGNKKQYRNIADKKLADLSVDDRLLFNAYVSFYAACAEENHTYEIGYLIGEEEYLNKGISKIIIRKLEEKIVELGGCEISADPSEENIFSIKALLNNSFKKKKDGDYRKRITIKIIEQ